MKYIMTLVWCAFASTSFCQKEKTDSAKLDSAVHLFNISGGTGMGTSGEFDSTCKCSVFKWDNNIWTVTGDSLSVIKLLWKRWQESSQREIELYDLEYAAVRWINTVSDYFKTKSRPKWKELLKVLKKRGYTLEHK